MPTRPHAGYRRPEALLLSILLLLAAGALAPAAAAQDPSGTPVPLSSLHLAGATATWTFGPESAGSCYWVWTPGPHTATVRLIGSPSGSWLMLDVGGPIGSYAFTITRLSSGRLGLTERLPAPSTASFALTGVGTTFTGTITSSGCVARQAMTLALAGSGLTLVAAKPSPTAAATRNAATPSAPAPNQSAAATSPSALGPSTAAPSPAAGAPSPSPSASQGSIIPAASTTSGLPVSGLVLLVVVVGAAGAAVLWGRRWMHSKTR